MIIGSIIFFISIVIHVTVFRPPLWITAAGLVGFIYYLIRFFWFTARIPTDIVTFFFETLLAISVVYGLLIG